MKKTFFLTVLLSFASIAFSQNNNILDYFPLNVGNNWTYVNSRGIETETKTVKNSTPDPNNKSNNVYVVETKSNIGTVTNTYGIRNNKIVILSVSNIFNINTEYQSPYPLEVALPNREHRYNFRGDDRQYKTSRNRISYDNLTFNDCILVEEQQGEIKVKRYYARGIGLVYETLQLPKEKESVTLKLTFANTPAFLASNSLNNNILDYFPVLPSLTRIRKSGEYIFMERAIRSYIESPGIIIVDIISAPENNPNEKMFGGDLNRYRIDIIKGTVHNIGHGGFYSKISYQDLMNQFNRADFSKEKTNVLELTYIETEGIAYNTNFSGAANNFNYRTYKGNFELNGIMYDDCLIIEYNYINRELKQRKYYAKGIGLVHMENYNKTTNTWYEARNFLRVERR